MAHFVTGKNRQIVYSITSGNEAGDFEILQNGSILTKNRLDRETQAIYNLVVTATDQAVTPENRLSSTVQVSLHESAKIFQVSKIIKMKTLKMLLFY